MQVFDMKIKTKAGLLLIGALMSQTVIGQDEQYVLGHSIKPLGKSEAVELSQFEGKVLLVVNTASQCGFTPQFESLEKLYKDKKDQGFEVLGFPSGDFGGQEFNNSDKIASFCQVNYGVTFPMFEKIKVKGKDAHPFYKQLAKEANSTPKWNFHKYLIGRDGKVIDSYLSWTSGDSNKLRKAVEAAL